MLLKESRQFILRPLTLVIVFAVLQLFIALLAGYFTFTHEEAMWHYIGRNWFRNGLVPYSGGVDNKSPLIFAIFGLSDTLFGVNYWFPRITGVICQSVGIWFLYKTASHFAGRQAAILTATFYGLSLLWKGTGGTHVSFTETYEVTLIIISFYYALTAQWGKKFFLSGFLAGIAFSFKISAIFGMIAIIILSFQRHKRTGPIFFVTGAGVGLLLITALLFLAGINLHDLFQNALTDNFGSGSTTDHDLSWKLNGFMNGFFYSELVMFYPFIAGFFLFRKKPGILVIWLICEFIGINVPGTYARNHFKTILPVLSLMSGLSVAYLIERYKVPFKPLTIIVWIVFFPKVLDPLMGLKQLIYPPRVDEKKFCTEPYEHPDDPAEMRLGLWVKSNTNKDDTVFVAGYGARVQVYAERLSPTIYFNVTQTQKAKTTLFNDLSTHKPALMVIPAFPEYNSYVSTDIRTFIDSIVARDYSFQTCMYGYSIYRLKK